MRHFTLACALLGSLLLAPPAHATFIDATYLTQTPNGLLNHEQALSTLSSGCLSVTTTTGVVASSGAACLGTHNLLSTTHPDTVAASPTLGDMMVGNVSALWAVLAGSTSATDKCLHQIGTGAASALPTWSGCGAVNAQTGTTYTVLASDNTKLVTHTNAGAIAVTLPQAGTAGFAAGFVYDEQNRGAGTVTITPTTSTIDGAATLTLTTAQGIRVFSDGANYFTQRGRGSSAGTDTFVLHFTSGGWTSSSGALAANTTYYLYYDQTGTTASFVPIVVPANSTLTAVYWKAVVGGTNGTAAQTVTHKLRKNNTTDSTGCTVDYSAAINSCSETGLSTSYSAGDYIDFKVVSPAVWTTPATNVRWSVSMIFTNP